MTHDALYRFQDKHYHGITRKQADQIYMDILIEHGVNRTLAKIRYRVLRWLGWIAWNGEKRKLEKDYLKVIHSSFLPALAQEYEIPTIFVTDIKKVSGIL